MHPRDHTIFALSSGRPPSAIALVRVSGSRAGESLRRLTGIIPERRRAHHTLLRDTAGDPIDDAIVIWCPGPSSATGEDVAEFHVHGSRAVLAALLQALGSIDGLRSAEPGEFTRRALENGKLDLTEAEGLDDLIHADTDQQRRQALRQLKGLLGDRARNWRAGIIEAAALIEAGIDFSDEGDVPDALIAPALDRIRALRSEIQTVLATAGHGERLRDGLVVAIAGRPNVGKSTLMNQLARREVAIVSPHAGTTRDAIEVQLDLRGFPVTLIDTAGVRETDDPVEREGVRRARARAAEADLVLWLDDGEAPGQPDVGGMVWSVQTKIDLLASTAPGRSDAPDGTPSFAISAESGAGIADLVDAIAIFAGQYFGQGETGLITRERQRRELEETVAALDRSLALTGAGDELVAEELRRAALSLGRLLGRVDVEDILDVIFREFCIGK